MEKAMHTKILKTVLILVALLSANVARAHHELIVTPQGHSERHSDRQSERHVERYPEQSSERRIGRREQRQSSFRNPYLTPYFAGGFGSGGDVVGRFTDNFGDTERVRSGGGLYFEGGLLAALDSATMVRLTAGYESDFTGRENGEASFDRTRFDLTLLRNFGVFELGAGVTAHFGVGYDCDINSICAGSQDFDNALGYTVEYALTSLNSPGMFGARRDRSRHPLRTARLGLRFTGIEYTPDSVLNSTTRDETLDGNSLSLFIGMAL